MLTIQYSLKLGIEKPQATETFDDKKKERLIKSRKKSTR
jgi:hypothetical protein